MKEKKRQDNKFRISTKIKYSADHTFGRSRHFCDDREIKVAFIVDEEKRTTIAILRDDNISNLYHNAVGSGMASPKEMQLCKRYNINEQMSDIIVKTKCAEGDTFDRNEGMKIALEKAKMIRFKIIREIVREIQNQVYRSFISEMNMLENRVANIDKVVERRDRKRNKLMKKINFTVTKK